MTTSPDQLQSTTNPEVFLYVQEGGSSTEIYVHAYDTEEDAVAGRKSCAEGAYRTSNIVKAPADLVDHPSFMGVVQALLSASLSFDYPED